MDKIFKIVGGIVVLGAVVALVLWLTGPSKRELPPVLKELSTDVAVQFAEKLPRNRDVNNLLLLLPRKGNPRDEELEFRRILKEEIDKQRKYEVRDWDNVKKNLDQTFLGKGLVQMGLAPGEEPRNLEEAVGVMKWIAKANQNFDGLLLVNVREFQEGQDGLGAKVSVDGEIYGVAAGKTIEKVPEVSEAVTSIFNYMYLHNKIERTSIFLRFFGWFLVASTLPFAMIGLVRAIVQKRKNELNLALVVGFTFIDVLLAWILISALGYGTGTIIFVLILMGLMGYYNYDACDYIERRLT
ncbi:MAG TPA: hypothetical protein VFF73_21545 [Planctomycetota bacterium]|nr:hypothetical protein [Planctomycetota bacterium]